MSDVSFDGGGDTMRIALMILVAALSAGVASSAWADKDKDKGHGQGRGPRVEAPGPPGPAQPVRVIVPARDRAIVYTYYRTEFAAGRCPPGLAKKGNGCLPGQAKKLWVVGRPLPPAVVYEPLPPVLVQQLAPVPP